MDRQDDFYRQVDQTQREQKKKERKEKWEKRERNFWKSFLLTEDGKPKSGLFTYTFFLSVLFIGLYMGGFYLTIEFLTVPLSALSAAVGNLIQSVLVGCAGVLGSLVIHKLCTDKRLVFCTHLLLAAYVAVCAIALVIMLWGDWEAIRAMLTFALWFAVIPVTMGLAVAFFLFRRDHKPGERKETPEWKKYVDRR